MKVLLISANTNTEPYPVYPIGLDYVAGAIIASGYEVQIADINLMKDYSALDPIIGHFSPDIIGISLRNIDNTDTTDPKGFIGCYRKTIEAIKQRSQAPIVLGGSGFTIFPEASMGALQADYGIIGEGERLSLLLDALKKKEDTDNIPGIVTARTITPIPKPWDGKPVRAFHNGHGHIPFYIKNGGMLNLQTKRGCNLKCIYCTYPHIEGRRLRLISPDSVAHTALKLQKTGAKYFFITDSAFNADVSHSLTVARAFKKNGVTIPWGAFFAPTTTPDNYFQTLADSGLTHAEFGTESLSDTVLTSYKKPFRINHVLSAHKSAVEAGLFIAHYFLLGGPGENSTTLDETLSAVGKLNKSVLFFFCGMRIYPHTNLYDMAVQEGQILENQNLLVPTFYRNHCLDEDEIIRRVKQHGKNRSNWVIGSGGKDTAKIVSGLYERGHYGPLWEYLIR